MFLEDIQQIEEERNFYYLKLRKVEDECKKANPKGKIRKQIMDLLS